MENSIDTHLITIFSIAQAFSFEMEMGISDSKVIYLIQIHRFPYF